MYEIVTAEVWEVAVAGALIALTAYVVGMALGYFFWGNK